MVSERLDGLFLVDKPVGYTCQDCLNVLKHSFHFEKIGHTGTLDPFASGLLLVLVGKATKLANYFLIDKTYLATSQVGIQTDTLDYTGKVVLEQPVRITNEQLKESLQFYTGVSFQAVPAFSAKKVNGKKNYELARQGKEVPTRYAQIEISQLSLVRELDSNYTYEFEATVSSGTYIRQLGFDLTNKYHQPSMLTALRRTRISQYRVEDASTLDQVKLEQIIPLEQLFPEWEVLIIKDYLIPLVQNGAVLDQRQIMTEAPFWIETEQGQRLAIYAPVAIYQYKPILIL
jgi:tRNA pseudouridine55 synthase